VESMASGYFVTLCRGVIDNWVNSFVLFLRSISNFFGRDVMWRERKG